LLIHEIKQSEKGICIYQMFRSVTQAVTENFFFLKKKREWIQIQQQKEMQK